MNILLAIVAALILMAVVALFVLGFMSSSGEASGLVGGRLTRCPDTPNCVCSEFVTDAVLHSIEPLIYSGGNAAQILMTLKNTVREMGGSIQADKDSYFAATFTSSIFRFVDDLEIRIDTSQKLIHLRSASRIGHGDRGVNRKRVERLKNLFQLKMN